MYEIVWTLIIINNGNIMNRERVTISIKKELLGAIDKKIDGVRMRNRSHAIESILSDYLGINSIKDVIIMAGGEDAYKNIEAIKKIIIKLKQFGIEQIIIALGFLGDKIKNEIGRASCRERV